MLCPKCAHERSKVLKTVAKGYSNERYRQCENCGYAWLTCERPFRDEILDEYVEQSKKEREWEER